MKKTIFTKPMSKLCLLLAMLILAASCVKTAPLPAKAAAEQTAFKRMFIYQKKLYVDTGEISTAGRCGVMDGKIQKTVRADQIPTKELQSNFGKGYGFQIGRRNRLEVCIDDTWHIFAWHENDLEGVSMKVKRNTNKSAVLLIQNTTDQDILWGDAFLLERKNAKTGEWQAVPYAHNDFGFNDVAYYAKKNVPVKWKASWSYIYGALKPGTYRIIKEFWDESEGFSDAHTLSATFRVAD